MDIQPRGTVTFKVAGIKETCKGKPIEVEASVLPRVTADLPTFPVAPVTKWKHLSKLEFADPCRLRNSGQSGSTATRQSF